MDGPSAERRSAVATGRGDDGTTGLLFGGERVSKDDPRTEAYGAIDEAVAALGLARAELAEEARAGTLTGSVAVLPDLILRLQRELFVAGGRAGDGAGRARAPAARRNAGDRRNGRRPGRAAGRDRSASRHAPRVRGPGRDAPVGSPGTGPNDRPTGRAQGGVDPQGRAAPRRPAGAVPQSPGGSVVDPGACRRAGRGAIGDAVESSAEGGLIDRPAGGNVPNRETDEIGGPRCPPRRTIEPAIGSDRWALRRQPQSASIGGNRCTTTTRRSAWAFARPPSLPTGS